MQKHASPFGRALALALTLILTLSLLPLAVFAADSTGACGENLTYTYNETSHQLKISGSGEMTNYSQANPAPWAGYASSITSISIGNEVTSIGDYAFYNCTAYPTLDLSETAVASIGDYAFYMNKGLTEFLFPSNALSIGKQAFAFSTAMEAVTVTSLQSLGAMAFFGATKLQSLAILGAAEGATLGDKAFGNCSSLKAVSLPTSLKGEDLSLLLEKVFPGSAVKVESFTEIKEEATVTVRYLDESGKEIAEKKVLSLKRGEEFSVDSPAIEGYELLQSADSKVTGTMEGFDITVDVSYKSIAPVGTDPSAPGNDNNGEDPAENPGTNEKEPMSKTAAVIFVILLVLIVGGISVAVFLLMRTDENGKVKPSKARNSRTSDRKGRK